MDEFSNYRNQMFQTPTPTEEINWQPFLEAGVKLYIKRDDLIHPVVCGNKWRKLKYLVAHSKGRGIERLVSFGGAYSNHLPALASTAAAFGLKSTGFVRGNELDASSNKQLECCAEAGMALVFVDRDQYRDKQRLFDLYFNNDPGALMVDEGGKSIYALPGCREIIYELDIVPDHLLLPVGTGTTMAGVAQGLSERFPGSKAHGIVVLKGAQYLDGEVRKLSGSEIYNYIMHYEFHGGGFAKTSSEINQAILDFKSATGIVTEYIYSGKMVAAALAMLSRGLFKRGEKVVLIHTGGVWF